MKQASRSYMRLMKIITVWVMAMFLFAPVTAVFNKNNETNKNTINVSSSTAQAGTDCKVLNAVFNPSSTGNSATAHEAKFFIGRKDGALLDQQERIIIKVRTSNCVGDTLKLKIYGFSENLYAKIENNQNKNVTSDIEEFVEFKPTDQGNQLSTTALTIYPGEYNCRANGGQDDCQLFIEIYRKINANKDEKIFDTNSPVRINQRGYLGYECTGSYCTKDWFFRLMSIDYNDTDPLNDLWYYTTSKKEQYYIAVGATDEATCKTAVTELKKDNSDIDIESCTNNPDYTKISSSSSIVNKGQPVGQAAVGSCFTITNGLSVANCVASLLKDVIYPLVAWLVALVAQMFDFVFMYTISADPYKNEFITYAWTFVRDICNASFIFILLYIAIMTVLNQTGRANYKTILPKVILVALIINFSLFFGRVLIDIGNVTARVLYSSDIVSIKNPDGTQGSITGALIDSFDPQNLIQNGASNFNRTIADGKDNGEVSAVSIIVITLLSILMLFMLCKLFFELVFIFIGRIVGLWMQLIIAPIAFMSWAIPFLKIPAIAGGGGGFSWFNTTFKQSIQVTVFSFFLFLALLFAKLGIVNVKVSGVSTGVAFFLSIIIPFLIIYTILETAKKQSVSMATEIANSATKAMQSTVGTIGGIALGAAGGLGVASLGRFGANLAKNETMQNLMSKKGSTTGIMPGNNIASRFTNKLINNVGAYAGSKAINLGETMSKSSFDARSGGLLASAFKNIGVDINANKKIQQGLGSYLGTNTKTGGFIQNEKNKEEKIQKEFEALVSKKTDKDYQQEYDLKLQKARLKQEAKYMQAHREAAKIAKIPFDENKAREDWEKTEKKKWQEEYEKNNPKPEKDAAQKASQQRQATYVQTLRDRQIRGTENGLTSVSAGALTGLVVGNLPGAAVGAAAGGISALSNNSGAESKFLLKYEKDRAEALKKVPVIERDIQNIDAEINRTEKEIERLGDKTATELDKILSLRKLGDSIKKSMLNAKALKDATGELNKYLNSTEEGKAIDKNNIEAVLGHLKSEISSTDTMKSEKARKALKSWYTSSQEVMVSEMEKHYDALEEAKDERSRAEAFEAEGKKSTAYIQANKEVTELQKEIKTFEKTNSIYSTQDEKSRKIDTLKERKKKKEEDQKEIKTKFNL